MTVWTRCHKANQQLSSDLDPNGDSELLSYHYDHSKTQPMLFTTGGLCYLLVIYIPQNYDEELFNKEQNKIVHRNKIGFNLNPE